MATITTRSGKGSPLTNTEVDNNFTNLNTDKVEKSGDTLTGDLAFGDNVKAKFGDLPDLQIYHTGTESCFVEKGPGGLYIRSNFAELRSPANESFIKCQANDFVKIYHDNTERLATTSSGVDITGTVVADGVDINGAGQLQFSNGFSDYATSSPSAFIYRTGTSSGSEPFNAFGNLVIQARSNAAKNVYVVTGTTPANRLKIDGTGDIFFYEDTGTTAKLTWDASAEELQFKDNVKAEFGDGGDLQIYHDGSNSYINESGTGSLILKGGGTITLKSPADENLIQAVGNGSVFLYYDNAVKLSTQSSGIDVTGTVTADGLEVSGAVTQKVSGNATLKVHADTDTSPVASLELQRGANDTWGADIYTDYRFRDEVGDLFIEQGSSGNTVPLMKLGDNSDISFYADDGTSQNFYWDASTSRLGIGTTSPTVPLHINVGTAETAALFESTDNTARIQLKDHVGFANIAVGNGNLFLQADQGNVQSGSKIEFDIDGSEVARFDSNGRLGIGTTSPSAKLHIDRLGATIASNLNTSITNLIVSRANTVGILISGASGNACRLQFGDENDVEAGLIEYKHNLDSMLFYTNSTEAARIDSSGRLGIGRTPTSHLLETAGEIKLTALDAGEGIDAYNTASAQWGLKSVSATADGLKFEVGNTERMRIDSSGNVGIGTTSPSTTLSISSASANGINLEVDQNNSALSSRLMLSTGTSGQSTTLINKSGALAFQTGATPGTDSGSEAMRIDSSGNVGIGTTSPQDKLNIIGASLTGIQLGLSSDAYYSQLGSNGLTFNRNGASYIQQKGTGELVFRMGSSSTEAMRITSSGRLGIGTTSPSNPLHVYHATIDTVANFESGDSAVRVNLTASDNSMNIQTSGTDGIIKNDGAGNFRLFNNGSERMRIDSSGNLLVGTTDSSLYNNTSGEGVGLIGGDHIEVARSGGPAIFLNRMTSDGNIAVFNKDGTTVGSIGTAFGNSYFASTSKGIRFRANDMLPVNASDGSAVDAQVDLGISTHRWRNLYLSGGISNPNASGTLTFSTAGSEAARFDSSGNLLVGGTSALPGYGNTFTGHSLQSGGYVFHSRSNNPVAFLNRSSSDGEIINLRKDGSTIGSIGVDNSDNLVIEGNSTHSGLQFGTATIMPHQNGAVIDNTVDLGYFSHRFKDLYLSGGVYLGGTGSANLLDDYEEGTWTPTFGGSTTDPSGVTYDLQSGTYTKIGRMVQCRIFLGTDAITSVGSGNLKIGTLPFTAAGNSQGVGVPQAHLFASDIVADNYVGFVIGSGTDLYLFRDNNGSPNYAQTSVLGTGTNNNRFWMTFTYQASS